LKTRVGGWQGVNDAPPRSRVSYENTAKIITIEKKTKDIIYL